MKIGRVDLSRLYPIIFTIIFIFMLTQYPLSFLESVFYDLMIRYDFGTSFHDRVVLITLDEESDSFLGEHYPYTYTNHQRFIERLSKDKPLIINYLVHLNEPDTPAEQKKMSAFKRSIRKFTDQGGFFSFGDSIDAWGDILPPHSLRDISHLRAIINVDNALFAKDDVSRRAILNVSGEDTLHLNTANLYRQIQGEKPLSISDIGGAYYLREADATFTLFRYNVSPLKNHDQLRRISFHRVITGNFPKNFFTDRIILVGSSYISNANDYVLTPFSKEIYQSSKLAVHSAIISSLIQNKTIYQLPRQVTTTLTIIMALALSFILARSKPTKSMAITFTTLMVLMVSSYLLFSIWGIWVYQTHLVLTVLVVYYVSAPFQAIKEYKIRYAIQEESKILKQVESLKQNFISLMSHDLKTPVAKIAGLADVMLQKHGNNQEIGGNLHSIIDSTKELNRYITSILDLTKIESRKLNLSTTSVDLNQLVESVTEGLKYQANQKSTSIELKLAPLYPIALDTKLMERVIANLIENAIKYSGEQSQISLTSWDDDQWVYLSVTDNGVGIPEQDLAHIFDKFYRVKNDSTHSIKGSGLGLYLVKYFVELHGGTISAKSVSGEGTTFTVKLRNA